MKKLLTILAIASSAMLGYSQGTIILQNTSATYAVSTNTALLYSGSSGTSGSTYSVANSYYYALLIQPYTGSLTTNWAGSSANWSFGEYGTNVSTGGMKAPGGTLGAPISGWGAPAGGSYDTGTDMYYIIAGWSASLGTTWATVQAQLDSGVWNPAGGFFGVSALAHGYSGGGPSSLPAPSVWGTGVNSGGLASGFQLFAVPVPEPSTFALAGLGAAALMIFRRKK